MNVQIDDVELDLSTLPTHLFSFIESFCFKIVILYKTPDQLHCLVFNEIKIPVEEGLEISDE